MELDSDNASGREQPQEGGDGGAGDLSDASASASSSKYERHYSTGSIYNYIPVPPSAFAPHVTDVKMHDRVANLADQLNRGSTRLIVERALADLVSKDRLKRQYRIQTRRRKSKIKVSDGDDEGVVPSRAGSGSKIGSRDQMKRCYARRPLPEIQIPDVDIPHSQFLTFSSMRLNDVLKTLFGVVRLPFVCKRSFVNSNRRSSQLISPYESSLSSLQFIITLLLYSQNHINYYPLSPAKSPVFPIPSSIISIRF